ncbi:MAG: peptidoglycan DD-metalloendopeptidase family protein [Bacteroidetes bacterium]|nr:peptidoglycan DD-metalloendopeptidase family protein [Bacteroidota bacterium]
MKRAIKISAATIFMAVMLVFTLNLNGQSRKELEKLRNKKEKEIRQTKKQLNETKKKKEKSGEVLTMLQKQIKQKEELVEVYNTELNKIDHDIDEMSKDVKELNSEIEILKNEFSKLVLQGYKSRHASSKINFLFSSKNFSQALRRFIYLKKILNFRKKQLLLIKNKKYEKNRNLEILEKTKAEKLGIVKRNEKVKTELEEDKTEVEDLLVSLGKKEKNLQDELRKKEKAYRELDAAIKRAIEAEIEIARKKAEAERKRKIEEQEREKRKNKNKNSKPVKPEKPYEAPPGTKFGEMKNRLQWPVNNGSISLGFGNHRHPTLPDVTIINNGINISVMPETSVKAVFEGEVSAILKIPGMKNTVLIKHGDFFTVYSKLENVSVQKGDRVKSGQKVGTIWTDNEGKCELHFEVWQGNQRLDPQKWLVMK